MTWEPISWEALEERPPVTPTHAGVIYPGCRHVISGPPESGKTWVAFCIGIEEIRAGGVVLHVDLEMNAWQTRERLRGLGASRDEIDRWLYVAPEDMASEAEIAELVHFERVSMVIVDAAAGAYALQGLDDNSRSDVEQFAATMIEPFRRLDVTVLLVDHVTKNAETRGRFVIGSERKLGSTDVHLSCEAVVPIGRGRHGLIRINNLKDRFGWIPRPRAAELELASDEDGATVTWAFKAAEQDEEGFRPTTLMERVSRHLEQRPDGATRNDVEKNVEGRGKYLREAMDALVRDGYASETAGPRGAKMLSLLKPFTSSDFVPTSSRTNSTTSSLVPPSKGDEDEVEYVAKIAKLGTARWDELDTLIEGLS